MRSWTASETKLLVFSPKGDTSAAYWQEAAPITMGGSHLPISSQAEHVGVLRSKEGGNMPALMSRLSAHGKSLYSVVSSSLARGHRGNPAASLRVEATYCAPQLYSGLATLLLTSVPPLPGLDLGRPPYPALPARSPSDAHLV